MKPIDKKPFEETQSVELTAGTFIISTVLFVLYMVSNASVNILVIAFPFVASMLVVNAIMFFHLLDTFIKLPEERMAVGTKILILLCNVPVTVLYYAIVMKL